MSNTQDLTHDREVLAAIFAARVSLAKMTEDEAAADARIDHQRAVAWVSNNSQKEGSFRWFCEEFDYEVDAVRRAVKEKK